MMKKVFIITILKQILENKPDFINKSRILTNKQFIFLLFIL